MIADTKQRIKQRIGGKWLLAWNEREVTGIDEAGNESTKYEYDHVWVDKLDKESIVEAIIRTRYSQNDEFKMGRLSKESNEWTAYNAFVEAAIQTAVQILAGL